MRPWRGRGCAARAAAVLGLGWLLTAGGVASSAAAVVGTAERLPAGTPAPLLLLVGDSTLAPQTGYGDALCARLAPAAACLNLGRGGRSTRSYRAEGLWDRVLARLAVAPPGQALHVLIQFGHNDQPGKPGRSTDLASEFGPNLARYVAEVRAAGGQPLLLTPLTRRSFREGRLHNDLEPWAEAVRAVARDLAVPLLDLNAGSAVAVQALGPALADTLAQALPGAPGFDRTHLGPRGACVFADLVVRDLAVAVPALRPAIQPGADCAGVPLPDAAGGVPASPLHGGTWVHPGWAVGTMGGRGGRILRVTTLAADGPGSLRAALETPGARTVVFEVGGVIDLAGRTLVVRQPFLTLAGQTAPSPGISIIRGQFQVATHDVVVQHLRFRPGAWGRPARSGGDQDGLSTQGAHHVIVDHCSFSWATDENLSVSGPRFDGAEPEDWRRAASHHITFSHNLIFEGLGHAVHPKGEHSKGTLVHDNSSAVLLLGNVWASNRERNALFKGGVRAAMVNNLIYNPGPRAVHYNLLAHEWAGQAPQTGQLALQGNVLRHGPDTPEHTPLFALGGAGDAELHLQDNLALTRQGQPAAQTARYTSGAARLLTATVPYLPPRLQALPAAQLADRLLAVVGARPWDRDEADLRQLSDIVEDRGRLIDSESQSSGFPRHAPVRRAFDPAQWNLDDMSPRAGWASLFSTPSPPPSGPAQ